MNGSVGCSRSVRPARILGVLGICVLGAVFGVGIHAL